MNLPLCHLLGQAEASGSAIGINLAYVASAILFILGMRMLGSADTARKGNQLSSLGMLLAVAATLLDQGLDYKWIAIGIAIGGIIGVYSSTKYVEGFNSDSSK